jgi:histidine triad (HIT) family protein
MAIREHFFQGHFMSNIHTQNLYDYQNVFARILRKELPCKQVLETPHTLAFHDVFPLAPVHVLVIPKGAYITADDFFQQAAAEELLDWAASIHRVIDVLGLKESGGYRLITNAGVNGGQIVPHFHMHVLGGEALPAMM